MISHDRAQELISARMDAPLTPAEHRELQGHLAACVACREFVMQADELARGLHVLPRLAPSPMVSRNVMAAIRTEETSWGWLRRGVQALSSPGMAVATSMALIIALASAMLVALNAPGGNNPGQSAGEEGTIAAIAEAPLPTEVPTEPPTVPPTVAADAQSAESSRLEPTATQRAARTVKDPSRDEPARTPTPKPTATSVPIVPAANQEPVTADAPVIEPSQEEPVSEAPVEEPVLAMAPEEAAPVEVAQDAILEQPAESVDTGEAVEPAPSDVEPAAASAPESAPEEGDSGRKKKDVPVEEAAAEPQPTRPIGPVPVEAIRALEGAGENAPDILLPPAPLDPSMPDQSFLPETPAPEWEGTPTPETAPATESEAPQLAEDWSGDLDLAGTAPEEPVVAEAPDSSTNEKERVKDREKRDKSDRSGESHEQQQAAFAAEPMAWSSDPVSFEAPAARMQTAVTPVPVEGDPAGATTEAATSEEPERQIDPATGMEIDPATGYLIDPTTGYLLDVVNDRIIDPITTYEVHPMTGLLIDPASGALLDPNTLAVVVPPGFGDDQPQYQPGSPDMRGDIETVVDDTYNSSSIRLEPPTDGPVEPIDDIVVPTESGEAVEIS